jgi:signal transduction histidine kinase
LVNPASEERLPRSEELSELDLWREKVFHFVLYLTLAVGFLPLVLWSNAKGEQGRFWVALPVWGVYAGFSLLAVVRRIAWRKRSIVYLAGMFLAGAIPMVEYGFRSQGPILMLSATVAACVFTGVRGGLVTLGLSLLVAMGSAWAFVTGRLVERGLHPITSVPTWLSLGGTMLFLGVSMVTVVGVLMRRLEESLATSRGLVMSLQQEVKVVDAERAATTRELGERKRAEELVAERDRVLQAASFAAERLLASRRWEDARDAILERLGVAAGVERITLAELVRHPERGEVLRVRGHRAFGTIPHWAERHSEIPVAQAGLEPFFARLRAHEVARVDSAALPDRPRALAKELGIAVGIALPIHAGESFWGFVGLEVSNPDFALSTILSDMLHAVAGNLGAAIARDRLNDDLESRVLERTERLAQANEELKAFSYTVSHDLRAPVRQIGAYAGMLRERTGGNLDSEAARHLDSIDTATRRMARMIDDLLHFHAIGALAMAATDVDTDRLVEEVVRECSAETRGREIAWTLGPLPRVAADRALLKHVFSNLIGNALKYTKPRARAEISVAGGREDAETVIHVRDNGVGFDPTYAHRLFHVFQRLHSVHEFEGSGIGLAHVKRIVERHGGRVWAEGALEAGATFFFSLPAARDTRQAGESAAVSIVPRNRA